eukprot:788811-Rhodomonas_salina.6
MALDTKARARNSSCTRGNAAINDSSAGNNRSFTPANGSSAGINGGRTRPALSKRLWTMVAPLEIASSSAAKSSPFHVRPGAARKEINGL